MWYKWALLTQALAGTAYAANSVDGCPGYEASNVQTSGSTMTADLSLAGTPCNVFGDDVQDLKLLVEYQTDTRVHVKIYDADEVVYQVPTEVLDTPQGGSSSNSSSSLTFSYMEKPFAFAIERTDTGETIFNTSGTPLVFQSQFLRLRTQLPLDPYIYGLGEDSDVPRRGTDNYRRTLWSRDAGGVKPGENLYGNHPVYFENRPDAGKTHGVFFKNSNGMDIWINKTSNGSAQFMEFNPIGGVVDLYFLAGPDPVDVAQQYSEVVGKPAMQSYWHFGFHQCKYGYPDIMWVAEVILNYTRANIPLETMWSDIDYMDGRAIFTTDPQRYPKNMVQELVTYLHDHDQHYVMMVDPAVHKADYEPYNRGENASIFLKYANGSDYNGVVWPGVVAFPDWFNANTQDYWNTEFGEFFDADTGIDIDALWIDMNEPSNFCQYPCWNPETQANGNPPTPPPLRTTWPALPGFPADFQPPNSTNSSSTTSQYSTQSPARRSLPALIRRQTPAANHSGLPGRSLITPPYAIHNVDGALSARTVDTDLVHANGLVEYDTHNLFGTMMSTASRGAMLARRPTRRPLVITRSTFAGAGAHVGHWLGDNNAQWDSLRQSVYQIQAFGSLYQVPMVGADVCGFGGKTTEELCARWASAGAFYTFYRNHAVEGDTDHEFYRWASVADAAQVAIKARYQLLDYIYTQLHYAATTGSPILYPQWFLYPKDKGALDVGLQYFYGDSILVAPVLDEGATSVDAYFPDDIFYDFFTYAPLQGTGANQTIANVTIGKIPVYYRGGSVVALRSDGANTTTALRKLDFEVVIAPGTDGKASGRLFLDDGDSLTPDGESEIAFSYDGGVLTANGTFGYQTDSKVAKVVLLSKDGADQVTTVNVDGGKDLNSGWSLTVQS